MNITRKHGWLLLALLISSTALMAQSARLKRGQKYMDDLNYIGAIEVYSKVLQKKDVPVAMINVAEAYRKIGDHYNAEYWYSRVVNLPEAEPIHKLYYGMALQRNGKCEQARPYYEAFVQAVPGDTRGQHLSRACDYEEELKTKNAGVYATRNMHFNSDLDDFSPALLDSFVVFASDRDRGTSVKRQHTWTGSPFNELYVVEVKEGKALGKELYSRPEKFAKELNTRYHDAAVSFSTDGKEVFYTRNNVIGRKVRKDDAGITRLQIYSATRKGPDAWTQPEALPFNSDEYSVAHPALSPDGTRLYFASDMPGGFGGMDLYYSDYDNGRWGPPINLGNRINTEGNEIFPTWHGDNTLYFSSDGHVGLGGLDIYRIKWNKEEKRWSEVENLGAPLNSSNDDLGLVLNEEGTFGYFSSDRPGGKGRDDIYSFVKTASPIEVYVYDAITKKPLSGVSLTHTCAPGERVTPKDGLLTYEIKLNTCCDFTASLEGYDAHSKEACTGPELTQVPVRIEIPLEPSIRLAIEGHVYDMETGLPLSNARVILSGECDDDTDVTYTDADGFYTFPLRRECCYQVKADKSGYLSASLIDQCTKGLVDDHTIQAHLFLQPTVSTPDTRVSDRSHIIKDPKTGLFIDTRTGKPANAVVDGVTYQNGKIVAGAPYFETSPTTFGAGEPIPYLLHIYYDFDRSNIRKEALPELEKLLKMLQDNPLFIVELASHTDARGSHRYNKRLSQRRAEAVVDWLVDRGISLDRLVPRGYGESMPVNDCVNNVPCSEKKHQLNRRTEFRILGCIGCVDPEQSRISKPNENPKVDPCKNCPF
jgi:outer membrane protein OmpA-like peptidoglycan-associated protein/tetratricopeptide (TPR) repeat protein